MAIRMSRDEIRAIYRQGEDAVVSLIEKVVGRLNVLEEEFARLKAQISKDSHNSSKPPSSDMRRTEPKNSRVKSGKSSGGQPGHEGHSLRQVENPQHTVKRPLRGKCACGRDLSKCGKRGMEKRQVFDLPPKIGLEVTEYQAEIGECACGRQHTAAFPASVDAPVQYGERIRAIMVYLSSYQLLPQKRTTELLHDLFGVPISEGTLNNTVMQAHARLENTEDAIKKAIRVSPVMNTDETGMYINGKRWWEHVYSTLRYTFYFCHPNRGTKAMRENVVLSGYLGRAIHDGLPAYLDFECLHGLCNAHHLRELVFVQEELNQRWAGTMIELLCRIKQTVACAKKAGRDSLAPATLLRYRNRYGRIITCGYRTNPPSNEKRKPGQRGRLKQSTARNLLDRLSRQAEETLAFMYDFAVPFDNNLSERDLRMTKVKQKVSGCFRSQDGAQAFCRIRGYISTVRKHGLNVFDQLVKCFDNGNSILLPE
jgi:transposase